jgi:hypothetical protein
MLVAVNQQRILMGGAIQVHDRKGDSPWGPQLVSNLLATVSWNDGNFRLRFQLWSLLKCSWMLA